MIGRFIVIGTFGAEEGDWYLCIHRATGSDEYARDVECAESFYSREKAREACRKFGLRKTTWRIADDPR